MADPFDRDRLPYPCEGCGRTLRITRRDLVAGTGRPYLWAGGAVIIEGHAVEVVPEDRRLG